MKTKMQEFLLETREGLKLTRSQVARRVGIDQSYYFQIEAEGRVPRPKILIDIAEVLGILPEELLKKALVVVAQKYIDKYREEERR